MRRCLLMIAIVVSLVVLPLSVFFWFRSLTLWDRSQWRFSSLTSFSNVEIGSAQGLLYLVYSHATLAQPTIPPTTPLGPSGHVPWQPRPLGTFSYQAAWKTLGFHVRFRPVNQPALPATGGRLVGFTFNLAVPYWFLTLATVLFLSLRLWHWRHPRYAPGLCPTCGYDLRASKERCPECGTPIPATVEGNE